VVRHLSTFVTTPRVVAHFKGMLTGDVVRFELPNLGALNFLLHGGAHGGGTLALKTDAQGKVYSTALLRMVIRRSGRCRPCSGLPAYRDDG